MKTRFKAERGWSSERMKSADFIIAIAGSGLLVLVCVVRLADYYLL